MNACKYICFMVCAVCLIITGCSEPQNPSDKQYRLIAAENMELQKQIQQRDNLIEKLKTQHAKELEQQEELLEQARLEVEQWKERSQQNVRGQVEGVLDTVMEENIELKKEIEKLNGWLETQRVQIQELERMLSESSNQ